MANVLRAGQVKVIKDSRGTGVKLRGLMFDVSSEKGTAASTEPARMPTRAELAAIA